MFDDRRIRKHGRTAQALVLSAKERSRFGSSTQPRYDFVLEVRPEDRAPFQAQVSQPFYISERKPREADVVGVKYEPDSLKVVFDLDGDPRFDLEAMNRRTTAMAWQTHHLRQQPPPHTLVVQQHQVPDDLIQQLQRLAALRASGAVTEEEFAALKADLLKGIRPA